MQSSPDVTHIFERGDTAKAKALMEHASIQVLHNTVLSSFVRSRELTEEDAEERSGDVLSWVNVLSHLDGATENAKMLKQWLDIAYLLNPTLDR